MNSPTCKPCLMQEDQASLIHWIFWMYQGKLVGGWTNPSEKYARQIGSSPQVGVKIKNPWKHHLEKWKVKNCIQVAEQPSTVAKQFWNKVRYYHKNRPSRGFLERGDVNQFFPPRLQHLQPPRYGVFFLMVVIRFHQDQLLGILTGSLTILLAIVFLSGFFGIQGPMIPKEWFTCYLIQSFF